MSDTGNEPAEDRQDLAEDRTDLAEDRTLLANERTFAGWCRTAFALVGLGLGFQALFQKIEPPWVAKAIASIFIALGVWVIWNAERRSAALLEKTSENHVRLTHTRSFRFLAIGVSIGAALLLLSVWILV